MLGLQWLVGYTKMGKAMRAVSEDKEVSALMGIDIDKVIVFTFAIGGMLAGAAGVINGLYRPQGVWFYMGFYPGIKAFTAAVSAASAACRAPCWAVSSWAYSNPSARI